MADADGAKARARGWRFIDLAELGINTVGSYGATLLRIILYPLAFTALLALAGVAVGPRLAGSWAPVNAVVLQFGPIVVVGAALLRSVVRSHHRPWRSLIAADLRIDWRRLAIGGGVELADRGWAACPRAGADRMALALFATGAPALRLGRCCPSHRKPRARGCCSAAT